jgi:hypothetical protein
MRHENDTSRTALRASVERRISLSCLGHAAEAGIARIDHGAGPRNFSRGICANADTKLSDKRRRWRCQSRSQMLFAYRRRAEGPTRLQGHERRCHSGHYYSSRNCPLDADHDDKHSEAPSKPIRAVRYSSGLLHRNPGKRAKSRSVV